MAGTITALRFQKRNRERVNVYLNGQFAFGLPAIVAARLRVGQTLDDEEIAHLRQQDAVERAYERALNFLSYRPRSTAEVRRNLHRKAVDETVIEAVVERLTRVGLLDDREFARYWVENRVQFNPRGERALRHELREKGVAPEIIADVLAEFDEEEAARSVAEKRAPRLAHLAPRDFRRKLTDYLARRGFAYSTIKPLVEELADGLRESSYVESEE